MSQQLGVKIFYYHIKENFLSFIEYEKLNEPDKTILCGHT